MKLKELLLELDTREVGNIPNVLRGPTIAGIKYLSLDSDTWSEATVALFLS